LILIWEKTISVSHWSCPHFSICLQHSADSSPHLYLHLFLPKAFAFNAHPEIPPSTDCGLRKCTLRWSRPPPLRDFIFIRGFLRTRPKHSRNQTTKR